MWIPFEYSSSPPMKYSILLLSLILACNASSTKDKKVPQVASQIKHSIPYQTSIQQRSDLKKKCIKLSESDAGMAFAEFIDTSIFPYWYGTLWDFNGVTQVPNEGSIACGYFVTTILRDAGVNINRVKMAQCASEQMINSLTQKKENYSSKSFDEFILLVKKHGKGLSVIGLDNHTGFLLNDGKDLYFVHSSFVGTGRVIKEPAATNSILMNSSYKVVGYISQDPKFIQRWLNFKG